MVSSSGAEGHRFESCRARHLAARGVCAATVLRHAAARGLAASGHESCRARQPSLGFQAKAVRLSGDAKKPPRRRTPRSGSRATTLCSVAIATTRVYSESVLNRLTTAGSSSALTGRWPKYYFRTPGPHFLLQANPVGVWNAISPFLKSLSAVKRRLQSAAPLHSSRSSLTPTNISVRRSQLSSSPLRSALSYFRHRSTFSSPSTHSREEREP